MKDSINVGKGGNIAASWSPVFLRKASRINQTVQKFQVGLSDIFLKFYKLTEIHLNLSHADKTFEHFIHFAHIVIQRALSHSIC